MKYRLTPRISYLIGFWKKKKIQKGIGVQGIEHEVSHFVKEILELKLTEPSKMLFLKNDSGAYFFNTKLRTFFEGIVREDVDRFKYKNEYSANYLAGMFDAAGRVILTEPKDKEVDNSVVLITDSNKQEEFILLKLGYRAKLVKGNVYIIHAKDFISFIKPFVKLKISMLNHIDD